MCEPWQLLLLSELVTLFSPHLASLLCAEGVLAPSWESLETLSPSELQSGTPLLLNLNRQESEVDLVCIHPVWLCRVHLGLLQV